MLPEVATKSPANGREKRSFAENVQLSQIALGAVVGKVLSNTLQSVKEFHVCGKDCHGVSPVARAGWDWQPLIPRVNSRGRVQMDVTSPFKSSPRATSECNRCGEEYEYHPTYDTGRICTECKEAVDDPDNCTYGLEVNLDPVTQTLTAIVTVSHDEPHTVHIPATEVVKIEDGEYAGVIAILEVEDETGEVLFSDVWATHAQHVLNPNRETRLNVNDDRVVGCDGSRSWTTSWGADEEKSRPGVDDRLKECGSPFDAEELRITVRFPAIEENIPDSTIEQTHTVPSYLVDL